MYQVFKNALNNVDNYFYRLLDIYLVELLSTYSGQILEPFFFVIEIYNIKILSFF